MRELLLVLRRELTHHVTRHARDDEAGAALGDDLAELLEHHRRAIEVDLEHLLQRRHVGRKACGVDHLHDRAERRSRLRQRGDRRA
jgi:hypothetical protein